MQTGIVPFTKGELILSNCSGPISHRVKGADWQMTSYHKTELQFKPLQLHFCNKIKIQEADCNLLFTTQTNYSGILMARKVKAVNGICFYEQNAYLGQLPHFIKLKWMMHKHFLKRSQQTNRCFTACQDFQQTCRAIEK